jgi:hypothetical protein
MRASATSVLTNGSAVHGQQPDHAPANRDIAPRENAEWNIESEAALKSRFVDSHGRDAKR